MHRQKGTPASRVLCFCCSDAEAEMRQKLQQAGSRNFMVTKPHVSERFGYPSHPLAKATVTATAAIPFPLSLIEFCTCDILLLAAGAACFVHPDFHSYRNFTLAPSSCPIQKMHALFLKRQWGSTPSFGCAEHITASFSLWNTHTVYVSSFIQQISSTVTQTIRLRPFGTR